MTRPAFPDSLGMWEATAGLPEQLRDATAGAVSLAELASHEHPLRHAVIAGEGTAAHAARAAVAYCVARATAPVITVDADARPPSTGPETMFLAVSDGGNGAGVLAAAQWAHERGAPVVAIATPGPLWEWAAGRALARLALPPALPAPRSGLGAAIASVLVTLWRGGLLPDPSTSLGAAYEAVARRRDALVAPGGEAEVISRRIGRTIPLVYGGSGLPALAAERWKTQINENAKTPAFWGSLPGLSQHEVAGWGQHGDITRQVFTLVTLRHAGEPPETARRLGRVIEATDEVMADIVEVRADSLDDLSSYLYLVMTGDFVSLWMAGREEIDPGPVPAVAGVEASAG